MSTSNKNNSKAGNDTVKKGKGKTAKQIMSRHIRDKNDIITDEEFKELKVGLYDSTDTEHERIELPGGNERPKDEDKDPEILTPWDLIK